MRILISEPDPMAAHFLVARAQALGCVAEARYLHAAELEAADLSPYDVLMVSPSLPAARTGLYTGRLRAAAGRTPYIVVLLPAPDSHAPGSVAPPSLPPAPRDGVNAVLRKPLDPSALERVLGNARHLTALMALLDAADRGEAAVATPAPPGALDAPTFAHVALSALYRVARGQQAAGVVRVSLGGAQVTGAQVTGAQVTGAHGRALGDALVALKRRSEILGRLAPGEFALLLQGARAEVIAAGGQMAARLAQGLCAAPGLEGTRVALTALALPDGEVLGAHAVEPDSCA
jgi:hypothetical protein